MKLHHHDYALDTTSAENRTRIVVGITAAMMLVEILTGLAFNSMALLADGWHMSTHVAAFLIAAVAYSYSRKHSNNPSYSFGTGKIGILGGYTSAILLVVIACLMAGESIQRLMTPLPIQFNQAMIVALIGLVVNLACASLLHDHHPSGGLDHGAHHGHHDLNRQAAYLHVLADALTSVTAIIALATGKWFGWTWIDPTMGLVGSVVVLIWAKGLIRDTGHILLDRTPGNTDLPTEIRRAVESDGSSSISDLHIWQIGANQYSAIVVIASVQPHSVEEYHRRIAIHDELVHLTVEVRRT